MQKVIDGLLINYQFINNKSDKDVVILPGWAHTSNHWSEIVKKLPNSHNYYILDLPGFGGTSQLPDQPNVTEYASFIFNFLSALQINQATLVGHSFGGQIAANLALEFPKKIKKLILISPAINKQKRIRDRIKLLLARILKTFKPIVPKNFLKFITRSFFSSDYADSDNYQKSLLSKITNFDLSHKVSKINLPTLVIWGSEDKTIPYYGKQLHQDINNSILKVIYPAGHNPHLTHPDKLAKAISNFL